MILGMYDNVSRKKSLRSVIRLHLKYIGRRVKDPDEVYPDPDTDLTFEKKQDPYPPLKKTPDSDSY